MVMKTLTFESAKTEYSATLCKFFNLKELMHKDVVAKFFEKAIETGALLSAHDFAKDEDNYKKYLYDLAIKLSETLYMATFLVNTGIVKAKRVKKFVTAAEFLYVDVQDKCGATDAEVYTVKEVNPIVVPSPVVQAPKPVINQKQNTIKSVVAPPISVNETVEFKTSTGEIKVVKQDKSKEAQSALPNPVSDGFDDEYIG